MTEPSSKGQTPAADPPAAAKDRGAAPQDAGPQKAAPKKPAAKKPVPRKKGRVQEPPRQVRRRRFVWWSVTGVIGASCAATAKFFFPRVLFEPATKFTIGYPNDYTYGVDTKWQQARRIWVVRQPGKLFVIFARCTHLGCTPDWKPAEHKFKCPCHGSGFDSEGVNFEGPAPQPLLRTNVALTARGEIQVDKGKLYPVDKWADPGASIVA